FPDLGDPWTAARRERDPRWYALETAKALVQAYGRSCRHAGDYGVSYVLDAQFERFLARYRALLPEWFLDAAEPALRARCPTHDAAREASRWRWVPGTPTCAWRVLRSRRRTSGSRGSSTASRTSSSARASPRRSTTSFRPGRSTWCIRSPSSNTCGTWTRPCARSTRC